MHPVYGQAVLKDSRYIRILTLFPGEYGEPLRGDLTPVKINEAGIYEPLSYVWGDSTRTHYLDCQHGSVELTSSLFDALQRLRPHDKTRRLWVDQICINQDDVEERSQQVQFMDSIYNKAAHVLVWLGEADGEMALPAFDLIRALASTFRDHESRTRFSTQHLENPSHLSRAEWGPLMALINRPWFTRTWIVQEIGTKAPATLFWGSASIEWNEVYTVCEELTTYHQLRKTFSINSAEVKYIYRRFVQPDRTSRHANRFSFIYELHRARHLKVTDPRDRVFAFLGHYSVRHSSNARLREMAADYTSKDVNQVYIDVAARTLEDEDEPLITLAAVQHTSLPSQLDLADRAQQAEGQGPPGLPTWVPDWRVFQGHILSEPTSPHCAGVDRRADLKVNTKSNILSIRGIRIDRIVACSECIHDKEFHITKTSDLTNPPRRKVATLWTDIAGRSLPMGLKDQYINGDPAILAFMQTLSNGGVATWWRQPEQDRQQYHTVSNDERLSYDAAYLAETLPPTSLTSDVLSHAARSKKSASHWIRAANGASKSRCFARTERGFYVLGPKVMEEGDVVVVLFGGKMPFCLRPSKESFLLVGECYVHGMMRGEAFETRTAEQMFEIV